MVAGAKPGLERRNAVFSEGLAIDQKEDPHHSLGRLLPNLLSPFPA
jgi:hypothetical protein